MINLFNIDIKKIRYGGANIKLIKLGNTIIYEAPISYGVYEPYQFRDDTGLTEVDTIVNETHDNLSYMFYGCTKLEYTNANSWITNNVTDMSYMFCDCDSIKTLDLSNFDTRKVTNMDRMFHSCNSLTELDLSNFNTKRCREDSPTGNGTAWLMPYCGNLYALHLDNCNRSTIGFILTHGDISHGNDYYPPEKLGVIYCKESAAKDLTPPYGWEFEYVSEDSPTELRLYNEIVDEFRDKDEITEVKTIVNESHTDLSYMFNVCTNLISVNTEDWITSNVYDMNSMFQGCSSLTELDLSNFDTSNVTNMSWMFADCNKLTLLDVSNFDTSNVYDMGWMFGGCSSLTELDVSNWDTSKVTCMDFMFYGCQLLTTLDLSNFDTSKVTRMDYMFLNCDFTRLDIRNFNINELTNVDSMLSGCGFLHELRLDNCNNTTISKIITSKYFPTNAIEGVTRTIYCKRTNAEGLVEPENWNFSYID